MPATTASPASSSTSATVSSGYRLGIGPRNPPEMDLKDFVLARFTQEQLTLIQQKTDTYVKGLELLLASGADRAMNQLNRRDIP